MQHSGGLCFCAQCAAAVEQSSRVCCTAERLLLAGTSCEASAHFGLAGWLGLRAHPLQLNKINPWPQVEGAPCVVKKGIKKEEAEELKKKLEAGAVLPGYCLSGCCLFRLLLIGTVL